MDASHYMADAHLQWIRGFGGLPPLSTNTESPIHEVLGPREMTGRIWWAFNRLNKKFGNVITARALIDGQVLMRNGSFTWMLCSMPGMGKKTVADIDRILQRHFGKPLHANHFR